MKTLGFLFLFLCSFQLEAAACKCNCDGADRGICASSYDIDSPCNGLCPGQSPGFAPMRSACPLIQVVDPMSGRNVWMSMCTN